MTETQPPAPPVSRRRGLLSRVAFVFSAVVSVGILVCVAGVAAIFAPGPLTQPATVIVSHGMHSANIAAELSRQQAVYLSPLFRVAAKWIAKGTLKAGEYAIPAGASMADIAVLMRDGRSVVRMFTVAEGLTSAEIAQALNADPVLTGAVSVVPPEGSLLPETYRYMYGDDRGALIARMHKGMNEALADLWAARDVAVPLVSPLQAVILASVVEKETGKPEERPRIAGVFYNRLRVNMPLQSDPTVIYALTKGNGALGRSLTHEDMATASPYNTYVNNGLPPQPICNPGRAALQAVLHPENNSYFYFVADGTGGHVFAADLAAHNRNVERWRAISAAKRP